MFESGWSGVNPTLMGFSAVLPADAPDALLLELRHATAGLGYLEWTRYRLAAELHTQIVEPTVHSDTRMIDAMTQCVVSVATVLSIAPGAGAGLIDRGVALRDRLPQVLDCLRDGLVAPKHIHAIVARTELVSGTEHESVVDAEIAKSLRKPGSWSDRRIRDMVDRIVYRHDPDAVRERRAHAVGKREFWTTRDDDGMAGVHATMTAEHVAVLAARVQRLADAVCGDDGRSTKARRSDALFCLTTGTAWECGCGHATCTAAHAAADMTATDLPAPTGAVVVHVVAEATTVAGESDAPGFVDGYGVISADHVRDIATRPGTLCRPLAGTSVLPTSLPSDPYRPSRALDTFVRARDQYCRWTGCDRAAWAGDLDHIEEFNHDDPTAGGTTTPTDSATNAACITSSRRSPASSTTNTAIPNPAR